MNSPSISIIVPAYNSEETIEHCIASLVNQDYGNVEEIVIIDNGSVDDTAEIADQYATRVYEYTDTQGSYAARNFGLQQVESDLVAFTDADCVPSENWISELVACYTSTDADLVGGNVRFQFENRSAAELYDVSTSMNNGRLIQERGCSVTANLLVRRAVFDEIGPFPQQLVSGGDTAWTGRATENGYHLEYCSDAIVNHPTRSLRESLRKHRRLGYGEGQRLHGSSRSHQAKRLLISLLPRPISYIKTDLQHNDLQYTTPLIAKLFVISWIGRLVQGYGKVEGLCEEN